MLRLVMRWFSNFPSLFNSPERNNAAVNEPRLMSAVAVSRLRFGLKLAVLGLTVLLGTSLRADPLDQQLLEDAPPKNASPSKAEPTLPPSKDPAPSTGNPTPPPANVVPRASTGEPLDTRHPLTRIAGKMELVEQRLTAGVNTNIVGLQREILADLDRLLTPGQPKNAGSEKASDSKQNPPSQDGKQNSGKQPGDKQPAGKQSGNGPQAANGSGTGTGNNEARKPTPRELMEATWGNLPARERERVFEAAGESFLPKYARSLRLYFERLAEEDSGK